MVAHVATVAFLGLEARAVECQVQIAAGLLKFLASGCRTKRWRRAGSGSMRRSGWRCRLGAIACRPVLECMWTGSMDVYSAT